MAAAKRRRAAPYTPPKQPMIDTSTKPTKVELEKARAIVREAKERIASERQQENAARFQKSVYGGLRADGRRDKGRLPALAKAFQNLAKTLEPDHYKFTEQQALLLLGNVELEFQKFRELVQAAIQREQARLLRRR